MQLPHLIEFSSIGDSSIGYLSVSEELISVPFKIARVYWTYYTPQSVMRGGHANINKELVLVAVAGNIIVDVEMQDGYKESYELNHPSKGLYIPPLCWHRMKYSNNAVQMVMASNLYSEDDYIREYELFKTWK
jgi:dTDP-4-dehydrorhamnose 3,5-epimerase-like enzyme